MGIEIERKFLVTGKGYQSSHDIRKIRQGFLSLDPHRVVRIRVSGEAGTLTIKGPLAKSTRPEFEYPIPTGEAENLLAMCLQPLIVKTRYRIAHQGITWEVDEFEGANTGLVIAEVELPDPEYTLALPAWVGKEVTDDMRYYNINLVTQPYSGW